MINKGIQQKQWWWSNSSIYRNPSYRRLECNLQFLVLYFQTIRIFQLSLERHFSSLLKVLITNSLSATELLFSQPWNKCSSEHIFSINHRSKRKADFILCFKENLTHYSRNVKQWKCGFSRELIMVNSVLILQL